MGSDNWLQDPIEFIKPLLGYRTLFRIFSRILQFVFFWDGCILNVYRLIYKRSLASM